MESIVIACLYLKKNLDFPFKKWKTKITECLQILNGEVIIQTKKKKKSFEVLIKWHQLGVSEDIYQGNHHVHTLQSSRLAPPVRRQ